MAAMQLRRLLALGAAFCWRSARGLGGDADAQVSAFQTFVEQRAYPFEQHAAVTEDGYRLRLLRVPRPGCPAVLLQHGILDSAWAWVVQRNFKALAFQIYDAGYDVWLGNNRGNAFSEQWASGASGQDSDAFWNFTFDEMARYDVPAMIEAVLSASNQSKLAFAAHSQGTMQFMIAASMPELRHRVADRASVFIALSPVAWLGDVTATLFQVLSRVPLIDKLGLVFPHGALRQSEWREAAQLVCKLTAGVVCKLTVDVICGVSTLDAPEDVGRYAEHFPFGTSWKNIIHFAQGVKSGVFRRYDYGLLKNLRAYGHMQPPEYDLSGLAVPTALLVAENDKLADLADVQHLSEALAPSGSVFLRRQYPGFSHATWLLGSREAGYYAGDVLGVLRARHSATCAAGAGRGIQQRALNLTEMLV